MQIDVKRPDPDNSFRPVQVTITCETREEFDALHAIGKANIGVPAAVVGSYNVSRSTVRRICTRLAEEMIPISQSN